MKTTIALLLSLASVASLAADPEKPAAKETKKAAAEHRQPVDLQLIKDKVSIKRGEQITVTLRPDGQRLLPRAPGEKAQPGDVTVEIAINDTTATPFRVEGDPTRPYLTISNSTGKPLRFRYFSREKGSKEFYEEEAPAEPVESLGEGHRTIVTCWESGSLVEEVVVCGFTPAPESAGEDSAKGK